MGDLSSFFVKEAHKEMSLEHYLLHRFETIFNKGWTAGSIELKHKKTGKNLTCPINDLRLINSYVQAAWRIGSYNVPITELESQICLEKKRILVVEEMILGYLGKPVKTEVYNNRLIELSKNGTNIYVPLFEYQVVGCRLLNKDGRKAFFPID